MQMEPQLMSLPSLSFPLLCSLPSLACFFPLGVSPCCSPYAVQVWECVKAEHCERTLPKSLSCYGPSALCTEGNFCGLGNCRSVSLCSLLPVRGTAAVKYCLSASEGVVHGQKYC